MGLIQNFSAQDYNPNEIALNWEQPLDFNNTSDILIVTKTSAFFPMELYNTSFPTKATDPRGIEIFRGSTIVGLNPSTVSVSGNILTDTSASFPTSPNLSGRLIRDVNSVVYQISSNTSTTITVVSGSPAANIYVVLADFPTVSTIQQNYEQDIRTQSGPGFINNLVEVNDSFLVVSNFTQDQYVNLIFKDGAGTPFIIKSNSSGQLNFFESSTTPIVGAGMSILPSFNNSTPLPYIDNFVNSQEAIARQGTGLEDDTFYYYTGFTLPIGANVAQAQFEIYDSVNSTQSAALSAANREFGGILYNYWANLYRQLDVTEDLQDLMNVFGFQFNDLYSLINTYNLQDSDTVFVTALVALSEQTGLVGVGYSIGIDTLRRIAKNMIPCWELKGSKQGIAEFIRVITTWDITGGTGDINGAISDFVPNIGALRFYNSSLGPLNTRMTNTNPFVAGGRFLLTLPGIIIPGFFTFREFIINIPNVALFVGISQNFATSSGQTTMTDPLANFGPDNLLVDNYLLPNEGDINDLYLIIGNTTTTITVQGIITNLNPGGTYAVLSPLNTKRFQVLNALLPDYQPYGTIAGFNFT